MPTVLPLRVRSKEKPATGREGAVFSSPRHPAVTPLPLPQVMSIPRMNADYIVPLLRRLNRGLLGSTLVIPLSACSSIFECTRAGECRGSRHPLGMGNKQWAIVAARIIVTQHGKVYHTYLVGCGSGKRIQEDKKIVFESVEKAGVGFDAVIVEYSGDAPLADDKHAPLIIRPDSRLSFVPNHHHCRRPRCCKDWTIDASLRAPPSDISPHTGRWPATRIVRRLTLPQLYPT